MKKIEYNKLVRDNIPNIINNQGKEAKIRILSDEEYKMMLDKKLIEEINEYMENGNIEELADVYEVIKSILILNGKTEEDLFEMTKIKANKNGKFQNKIFLENVIEK